jgi:hypothetical protein
MRRTWGSIAGNERVRWTLALRRVGIIVIESQS